MATRSTLPRDDVERLPRLSPLPRFTTTPPLTPGAPQTCSWSPGGELLAVGGHDRHVMLLNAVTWQPLMEGEHGERVGAPASVVVYREVGGGCACVCGSARVCVCKRARARLSGRGVLVCRRGGARQRGGVPEGEGRVGERMGLGLGRLGCVSVCWCRTGRKGVLRDASQRGGVARGGWKGDRDWRTVRYMATQTVRCVEVSHLRRNRDTAAGW